MSQSIGCYLQNLQYCSIISSRKVAISGNANLVAGSTRAKLSGEDSRKTEQIVNENLKWAEIFITLQAGGFIQTKGETADALDKAEQKLIALMSEFGYENQLATS